MKPNMTIGENNITNTTVIGTPLDDQIWTQDSAGVEGVAESGDSFGRSLISGDFDGDGIDDLAIGVSGESVDSDARAGAVNTLYGSNTVLNSSGDQIWYQDVSGIVGVSEQNDLFGQSLASGDFNGDGRDDLAIGVPGEEFASGTASAGAVNVLYGSVSGLTASRNQLFHQDTSGIEGEVERNDQFGSSLIAGDFNGDGRDDLAIGVHLEDVGSLFDAGAVNVMYGSNQGLTAENDQIWHQDTAGVEGVAEAGDTFGKSLAAGDFDGDGRDDLAIGVPGEDLGSLSAPGVVNILYGSNSGLSASGDQVWHQDSRGIIGAANSGDIFGESLAAGDFDGDGRDDLAIGVPGEDVDSVFNSGGVNVLYGSNDGLTSVGNQFWSLNTAGVLGTAARLDGFGAVLAVGDFNGDGRDDLAIGAPQKSISGQDGAGAVTVLYGSNGGLTSAGSDFWSQNSSGVQGAAGNGDRFGASLTAGDFNNDGFSDLAIGAPGDGTGGVTNILYGSSSGLFA